MNNNKILVVDDEPMILEMLAAGLESGGYTVITVGSAEHALEILQDNNIHVMFLDQQLPGMNGLELCQHIKQNDPAAIVYAMSGYSSIYGMMDCREAGFEDYFAKPLLIQSLIVASEEAFEKLNRWSGAACTRLKYEGVAI
jgi:CheY-like chemotaxis protein